METYVMIVGYLFILQPVRYFDSGLRFAGKALGKK